MTLKYLYRKKHSYILATFIEDILFHASTLFCKYLVHTSPCSIACLMVWFLQNRKASWMFNQRYNLDSRGYNGWKKLHIALQPRVVLDWLQFFSKYTFFRQFTIEWDNHFPGFCSHVGSPTHAGTAKWPFICWNLFLQVFCHVTVLRDLHVKLLGLDLLNKFSIIVHLLDFCLGSNTLLVSSRSVVWSIEFSKDFMFQASAHFLWFYIF